MPDGRAFLRVSRGTDKGKGWHLEPDEAYTIGRSRRCSLRLSDPTVSATHGAIKCRDGVWFISDRESSHGIHVNRQRIMADKPLFDRDRIRMGKTYLEFREYEELDPDVLAEIERGVKLPE